ncbi:MAG: Ig domain-containing protein [Dethiobacter sp.]|nr:MAG: Ig domain-containing protein [Dethiobacter sp.]
MLTSDVWLDDVGIEISNPPSLPDTSIRVTGVTLNLDTLILTAGGVPAAITVTIIPSDATNRAVTWTSSAPAVATVDATGLVIAVSAGTATITVTTEDGGHTATSVITVVVPVTAPAPAPALAPVAPAPAPAAVVEQRVAAGRPTVVKLEGVVEITVTAGAVTGDAPKITAQVLPEAAASPMLVRAVEAGLVAVGGVVQLTLTGGEFAGSVQFTLNFDAAKVAAGRVPSVFVYNERTGRWIYLGGQVGNGTVTVTVDRFSKFAVFASRPLPALADIATHWGRDSIRTRALCLIC